MKKHVGTWIAIVLLALPACTAQEASGGLTEWTQRL